MSASDWHRNGDDESGNHGSARLVMASRRNPCVLSRVVVTRDGAGTMNPREFGAENALYCHTVQHMMPLGSRYTFFQRYVRVGATQLLPVEILHATALASSGPDVAGKRLAQRCRSSLVARSRLALVGSTSSHSGVTDWATESSDACSRRKVIRKKGGRISAQNKRE